MLPQFTTYFFQFHQVHVPSVGTIRLIQQPASLDVAAKLIRPPQFEIRFSEDGWLTKHQLVHFGAQLHFDEEATRKSLEEAGAQLKKTIQQQPFLWNGIGTFTYTNETLLFEPHQHDAVLQPVTAERVLREGVQHSILIGDQMVLSDGHAANDETVERHWNWSLIAGWSIVVLALFFILFFLYQHQFGSTASGLREKVTAAPPPAAYVQ
jgi:hypothetical protein